MPMRIDDKKVAVEELALRVAAREPGGARGG